MPKCLITLFAGLCLAASSLLAANPQAQAEALLKDNDPRAGAEVARLAKDRPKDPAVRVLQLRVLLQDPDKAEQAVESGEDLVDDEPTYAPGYLWLANAYVYRIGQVGNFTRASMAPKLRRALERAIELDPDLHEARSALMGYYLQAPGIVGGSVDKAKAQIAELQRRDPPRGHFAQGQLAQYEKREDDARGHFLAAYAARPGDASYRMTAGYIHQQDKNWDQAFALYEAWTREEPKAVGAWYQLGRTAVLSEQRLDQGVAAFKRFLALPEQRGQPEHKYAWYRMGQALALAGDKTAAREALQKALGIDPELQEAKDALASL